MATIRKRGPYQWEARIRKKGQPTHGPKSICRSASEMGTCNPMEVAAVTGHKDLKMLKRYTLLRAEDLAVKLG